MTTNSREFNSALGDLVSSHRKAQGRSARNVARDAGIDINTMVQLEKGTYASPSPITLKGVSKALGIPLLELFHAAGYVTPYDLVDLVTAPSVESLLAEQDAIEARSRYIAELIEKHGLDYTEPGAAGNPESID
ncbi:helix-turn-helix domain-containing protein [Mycobacteroides abscessus]|uniref:helix-turn-helix domain-containing protein n=1 Tax=Mycobacteroides abscessus TaxID=36809 RepID=UPI00092975E9|nr:helix-turn-helix transcriptional regulator [Mycobacteroides abscessus]SIM79063.1 putative transcriptional regulator [Mycobacteroides abscessus subsp. abscessus]